MFNIIKAELYKYTRRVYLYVVFIIILLISISLPIIFTSFKETFGEITRYDLIQIYNGLLQFIPFSVILFASVFFEEYTEKTLKNLLPWNISKSKVYISKYIVQILFAGLLGTILIVGLFSSLTLLPKGDLYSSSLSLDLLYRLLANFPSLVANIAIVNLFIVIFKDQVISYLLYFLLVQNIPNCLNLAQSILPNWINSNKKYIIGVSLEKLSKSFPSTADFNFNIFIGIIYIIFFLFVNLIAFKKQETI